MAGRAGWALTDQGISSFTNFALGVLIARSVSQDDFGAFSLAFSTYLVVLNLARAVATQPLVIRFSGVPVSDWRRGSAAASGTMLVAGMLAGILCLGIGLVTGPRVGPTFVALGIALPAILVQDAWRFAFFAAGRDRDAVLTDLAWAVGLVVILTLVSSLSPGTAQFVLGWGASAALAALVGSWRSGLRPRPLAVRSWIREHSDLVGRFSLEVVLGLAAPQAAVYVVGLTAGLAAAGSIRAAQLILGPMHVLLQAAHLIAVPEGVRIRRNHPGLFRFAISIFSAGLALGILAFVVMLMVMPDAIGVGLLGESWHLARLVLLPLGLSLAAQGFGSGALVGLRVLSDAAGSLRGRVLDVGISLALVVGGGLLGGAIGAAWGMAINGVISALIFTLIFLASERRHRRLPS